MRSVFLSLLFLAVVGGTFPALAQDRTQVLLLEPADALAEASRRATDGLVAEMTAKLDGQVDFFIEFLDAYRYPTGSYPEALAGLLRQKYADKRFDLIFALGPHAYRFIADRHGEAYLDAPVVFLGMREATLAASPPLTNATGIISKFDLVATVGLAQRLQHDLRNLYVITGASPFDRAWEEVARRELSDYPGEIRIHFLASYALDDLMLELSRLPPRSALLYLTIQEDGAGDSFKPFEVTARLAQAAPVYGVYSTYLTQGLVGGYMDTFENVGRASAALALRILDGEAASSIPPGPSEPQTYVVNWPAIERWGLDGSQLPENTIVLNRKPPIWDEYREQIVVFVTLLLLQTLLIVALLAQGRRKKRTELQLAESEDHMRLAASAANLGLWRWDSDTNRVWMTDHCRSMLGQPPGKDVAIGQLLAVVHREDRRGLQQQIERSARWHTPFDTECRIVLPDGSLRWLSVKGQSPETNGGLADQVTGVVIDVSERKCEQIEAEKQKSQLTHLTRVAILGELSGAMAHELNQPLTAILSNAQAGQQLIARDPPDLEEVRGILADIVADDLRAGEVIRRLRSLLKRDDSRVEKLDLSAVVADVLDLAGSELLTHQISLEKNLDPALPAVLGDRIQLQQVLLNLIVNACEAMAATRASARSLRVVTREGDLNQVEVAVSDSGPGIAEEILEQLFEPFSTTKQTGLGLGLSISRAIVAAHNGSIKARNGSGGATFSIRLPSEG